MDEYYRILESLPPALRTPLAKLDAHYAPHVQEIRLRLGQPIQFTICGRLCPAAKFLPGTGLPAALETDTLRDCFLQLCRRSVYAYEDELKQGYFTVQGGCRIGVAITDAETVGIDTPEDLVRAEEFLKKRTG